MRTLLVVEAASLNHLDKPRLRTMILNHLAEPKLRTMILNHLAILNA